MSKKTHGEIKRIDGKRVSTPEYRTWQMMKNRCYNPNARDYAHYGGRGIGICKRWRESFEAFLEDMGRRPGADYTLDRINGDKNYTPKNCRWATRLEQARNRAYAKTKTWLLADLLGISVATAKHMIWQVRAKDRGNTKKFELSEQREQIIRNFLKAQNGTSV